MTLRSWKEFPRMAGESRRSRRARRAADDPDYRAHLEAVARMPEAVQEAWALYQNGLEAGMYPHGFSSHFPRQWRWKELQDAEAAGRDSVSQRALRAAGLGRDTRRRPDGSVDRWPSGRPMGQDSPGVDPDFDGTSISQVDIGLWTDDDGTIFRIDRDSGEILGEL